MPLTGTEAGKKKESEKQIGGSKSINGHRRVELVVDRSMLRFYLLKDSNSF